MADTKGARRLETGAYMGSQRLQAAEYDAALGGQTSSASESRGIGEPGNSMLTEGARRLKAETWRLQAETAGVSRLGLNDLSFAPSCETEFGGLGWNRGSWAAQGSDGGSLEALG